MIARSRPKSLRSQYLQDALVTRPRHPTSHSSQAVHQTAMHSLSFGVHAAEHADKPGLFSLADPGVPFPFLAFPYELRRMIFNEVWRTYGLGVHLVKDRGVYSHRPCRTNPNAPDRRFQCLMTARNKDVKAYYLKACKSDWQNHWECQPSKGRPATPKLPFLPVLLTCKMFYNEGVASLLDSVTFIMTDMHAATTFLTTSTLAPQIRSLYFPVRLRPKMTALHSGQGICPVHLGNSRFDIYSETKAWEQFCSAFASLIPVGSEVTLRQVRVWLDVSGEHPWDKCADESALLNKLLELGMENLLLDLPTVSDESWVAGAERVPQEARFLKEGETAGIGGGKVRITRGERPDKAQVSHFVRAENEMRRDNARARTWRSFHESRESDWP